MGCSSLPVYQIPLHNQSTLRRLSLPFAQRFLPFLGVLLLSHFLLRHMRLMSLPVRLPPQLGHIRALSIINFDYCTILFLLGVLDCTTNVRTSNFAKQSISHYNYWFYNHHFNTWSIFRWSNCDYQDGCT
uniref:Uncharacterized protein n=1 Tax=uncultured marine thaumarchaeote SAT1000_09_A04 TaxID=1456366 RepID=A0A075I8J2_9ARCH|nr:hypothetical protein [uncultured marine thaumarchaeote SAT1000_09_A04]